VQAFSTSRGGSLRQYGLLVFYLSLLPVFSLFLAGELVDGSRQSSTPVLVSVPRFEATCDLGK